MAIRSWPPRSTTSVGTHVNWIGTDPGRRNCLHRLARPPTAEDELEALARTGVIFKADNPVELVTKGETLGFNLAILGGIGFACITFAFLAFAVCDLPANG